MERQPACAAGMKTQSPVETATRKLMPMSLAANMEIWTKKPDASIGFVKPSRKVAKSGEEVHSAQRARVLPT